MRGKGDRIPMIQKRKTKHRSTRAILRIANLALTWLFVKNLRWLQTKSE
jgi:hypothetical protein